ncbi:MAG: S9 family peptidase [Chthoniobacterales bacterium]|nr:S9 family peptidase [Chthoniobacterales bacterium]
MTRHIPLLALLLPCAAFAMEINPSNPQPPVIPLRDFFRNPVGAAYQVSPGGDYISWLAPWENRLNVFVQPVDGSAKPRRLTDATKRDIAGYFWAAKDQVVYLQDDGGDENFHLYAVNADGTGKRDLTPFPGVRVGVVDDLRDDEDHLLISMNKRDARVFDVFRLNTRSGEMELVAENPGSVSSWVTDHDGKVRAAVQTDGVNTEMLYRETEDQPFRKVLTTDFRESVDPMFFTYDNKELYATSNLGRDKAAIVRLDPATGKELELLFEHPEVDTGGLIGSDKRKVLTAAVFTRDKTEYHFFDEWRRNLQEKLEKKFPGSEVALVSTNRDEDKFIVRTHSDRTRGAFWFYDDKIDELRKLSDISPWLDENQLAPMVPVRIPARDGLELPGYLTLPPGLEPKNLPAVLYVHGGPWARDAWGFDGTAQFLANRGYAVLQVNYRGSTGYGRAFWEKGFKQWGKSMQDDLTDASKWLVEEGIADPKRIAIYGGSYGGYAALAGMALTPGVYAAGISFVGPSNLFTLLATVPPYWEPMRKMNYEMIGDPEKEKELLTAASPLFSADKIGAPLLIAQGANDPRVKKAESDQIVEALKRRGIDVPYIVKSNEGHGFANEENRLYFYRAVERFLARHLGGRTEQSDEKISELESSSSGS